MKITPTGITIVKIYLTITLLCSIDISAQAFTDSNLPIVIITTDTDPDNGEPMEIQDDPRILATMKIIRRPDGSRNYLSDQETPAFLNYDGRISIETRGSSSQALPKKGYGLTTLEADDSTNNNVSLLDMPSENDWILNGLAFDQSLIRDYLSYNLSSSIGNYAPRAQYCEVVINGDYRGLYLLVEKIKADSDRVNILKITPENDDLPELTGGYITKADKTTGNDPVGFVMSSYNGSTEFVHDLPKPEDITDNQASYVQLRFLSLAAAAGNTDITTGYPAIIDVPTFVDFMLINEIASNVDAYQISTFFHQDRNGKLRAGPVWDLNLAYGNDLFSGSGNRSRFDVWQFDNDDNTGAKFWRDLFDEPTFRCYLSKRFSELIQPEQPLRHNNLMVYIDNTVENISEAIVRENERWNTIYDHPGEIDNMKQFLYDRINWMTENLGPFEGCNAYVPPPLVISRINYNPGEGSSPSNDREFIEITNNSDDTVDLNGIYLRELGITYQLQPESIILPGQAVYIVSNPDAFQSATGLAAFGQYTRNLSNGSQSLVLADAFGNIIDSVTYADDSPWPDADGNGYFLQLSSLSSDNSLAENWIAASESTLASELFNFTQTVSLSPNPVRDELHINSGNELQSVQIFDLSGRIILSIEPHAYNLSIVFSTFQNGIYLIKCNGAAGSSFQKIVKQ